MPLPDDLRDECSLVRDPAAFRGSELEAAAARRLDSLLKPPGSLGRLEEIARTLHVIQGSAPLRVRPARVYVICADHGIMDQCVSSQPREVTALLMRGFLAGGLGINCLCRSVDAQALLVDAGCAACMPEHPQLIRAKIAPGTADMSLGPAMSAEQCLAALRLGVELAAQAQRDGVRALGTGEIGIGNSTVATALFCACLGFAPEEICGMGAGCPPGGIEHKISVIRKALRHNEVAVRDADPVAALSAFGGFEIIALAGLIIGAAARSIPVMVDGFISTAAFVAACRLAPAARFYCFFSHASAEAGHVKILRRLGVKPFFDLGMRLGEGTGAALGFTLLDGAASVFNDMLTLESAGVVIPAGG
ncbi:MAG: nicotinate-nucleotide--dimethylbenzimidazole phosphoribosyltransferase [Desulfovibrio sp.]|jgi:nicotinate-nucleotide--dimethylbenzimidazole phosphoribosyltransferase|nr:nicotinate-nucleotide--dimethylbenzimidazole phosphoribosyltransferase [Desulfovibrio sp.]